VKSFNRGPTIVGPPLRAKKLFNQWPLASEPVLNGSPSGTNQAQNGTARPNDKHSETHRKSNSAPQSTQAGAQVEKTGKPEKDQPSSEAAFGAQEAANQRRAKQEKGGKRKANQSSKGSKRQATTSSPRKGSQKTKPEITVSRGLGTSIVLGPVGAPGSVDYQPGSSLTRV
jgi:hypothetical protein